MVAQDWMPPAGAQLSKLEPSDTGIFNTIKINSTFEDQLGGRDYSVNNDKFDDALQAETRSGDTSRRHVAETLSGDTERRHVAETRSGDTERRHGAETLSGDTSRRH